MKFRQIVLGALVLLLLQSVVIAQYIAWDPTRNIPNGRVLALGKAYMALSDDTGAIYSNPAGLANIERWQFSSMSGRFMDEYTYLSLSGLYPTELGVIGLGFAGSSIGGAYVTKIKEGSDPNDPIYEIDYSVDPVSNYNNVMILSWGNKADKFLKKTTLSDRIAFLKHPLFSNLSVGFNFKYFMAGLTGDHIDEGAGTATGNELDLAIQYKPPQKWLNLGVTVQNVLPFSMGGKLSYGSGHEESYPAIIESGVAIKLMAEEDGLIKFRNQEIVLLADFDYYPTLNDYPILWHLGAEWRPTPMFAIRGGLDQDAAAGEAGGMAAITNLTGGVGLLVGGFRFDYAYHTYAAAPGIDNSFFSLSYGIFPPEKERPAELIKIFEPEDKLITFDEEVTVKGEVVVSDIARLYFNGVEVKRFNRPASFEVTVPLSIGKNKIVIEGYGRRGKLEKPLETKNIRILRLITFPDVIEGYWVRKPVSLVAMQGIVKGYPDGTFRPEGNITRAEMATLLIRTNVSEEAIPTPEVMSFTDMTPTHWAVKFIEEAAATGVVLGYPDGTFKPNGNITRAEGLTMITRFTGVSKEAYKGQFPDVQETHWAAETISGAFQVGVLEYLLDKPFEPSKKLMRDESVEMLYKTPYVIDLLERDLLNWDTY